MTRCVRCGDRHHARGTLPPDLAAVVYLCCDLCQGCIDDLAEWWAERPLPLRRRADWYDR